jgi:hypothetical protein
MAQPNMADRITLGQVAETCQFSLATVPRALRDHPRIPPSTRQRVREAAERLGYRPDPALSALVAHRESRRRDWQAPRGDVLAFVTRWLFAAHSPIRSSISFPPITFST